MWVIGPQYPIFDFEGFSHRGIVKDLKGSPWCARQDNMGNDLEEGPDKHGKTE
jgi:hypothetical protein